MTIIPFGEYLPDQPAFANPGAATIENVLPLTQRSYGPAPGPAVFSDALTARCQGALALKRTDGTVLVFAGDAARLYEIIGSTTSWTDVSKSAGGPYNCPSPADGAWSMTAFGNRLIATNGVDPVQTFLVESDTAFSDLSGDAPLAKYAATIRDFLMLGNLTVSNVALPQRLQWSAIGDPTSWPTPGTDAAVQVQSDNQDLQQTDLGNITGLVGSIGLAYGDGAAFCERGIYRITYVGSPAIFDFSVAQGAAGTLSPLSIVPGRISTQNGTRPVVFYLGEDGFYAWDGVNSEPIGAQKIDKTFFNDLDPSTLNLVQGAADANNKLVFWAYSASGAGGLLNRMLVYNWDIGRWALIDLTGTPAEWLTRTLTTGYTLDQLDVFGPVDTLPFPLDSAAWLGGRPVLSLFDTSHRLNYLTGSALAPTVETGEIQPFPGRRAKIVNIRPLVDGGAPLVAVGHRDRTVDSTIFETAVAMNALGSCPQRVTGRYHRFRLTLPAASTFTHLQGLDVDMRPEGRLR